MTTSALLAALFIGSFFHINLGPDIKPPVSYDMPPAYVASADRAAAEPAIEKISPETAWWTLFKEPVLDKCVEEAFSKNRDLETALTRIAQARASFKEARGNQRPNIGAQGDASRSIILGNSNGASNETNVLDGIGAVSYEADLFGKLQKATRAEKENILATIAAKDSVRLALASSVVRTYFSLRAADKELAITKAALKSQIETVKLNRIRFEHGKISELDLRRSEALAASSAVSVRRLETALAQYENALLVLLGREPKEFVDRDIPRGAEIDELPEAPEIPSGIPADLLRQRPDVKQAEQNYKTALANLGSARAGQYPTISFSGLIGSVADDPSSVFTGPTGWSLAAQIFAPIYNGGKLSARARKAEGQAQQMWSLYYKTVQSAFEETMNALAVRDNSADILKFYQAQEQAQSRAYDLARVKYENGQTSQLELLDAERELLSVRLALEGACADRLSAAASLCAALGGGWNVKSASDIERRELQRPWSDKQKFSE